MGIKMLTLIPTGAPSRASERPKPMSPALAIEYAGIPSEPIAALDDVIKMRP